MEKNDDNLVLKVGIGIPVLCFVLFLAYWFGFRDSWDIDNYSQIVEKAEAVDYAIASSDDDAAARAYHELLVFIGDYEIKEPSVLERIEAVKEAFASVERRIKQAELESERKKKRKAEKARLARQREEEKTQPSADEQALRTVALSRDTAPGIDNTSAPKLFSHFQPPILNIAGQTAFRGFLSDLGENDSSNEAEGIWSEGGGDGLALVTYKWLYGFRPQAPGITKGEYFMSYYDPIINDAGQIAFYGNLMSFKNTHGIWSEGSGKGLTLIALAGDQAPRAAAGAKFAYLDSPVLNGNGQIAFFASLTGEEVISGIWSDRDGDGLSLIACSQNQAPGTERGVNFFTLGDPVINDAGQIAFLGNLNSFKDIYGIWSEGKGNGLALVVRSGSWAPGTDNSVVFSGFDDPTLNNAGQTAFRGDLSGKGVNDSNSQGVWSEGGDSGLTLVARTGSHAPGTDNGVSFSDFPPISYRDFNLALNGAGQTAFVGHLTGEGVDRTNDFGIWSEGSGSGLTLVARSGTRASGTKIGVNFSRFRYPVLNDAGQVAFVGGLIGNRVDESNNWGIWAEDSSGVLTLIACEGDQLDVDDGLGTDFRTINSLSFVGGTGNEAGHPSGFNNRGQVAFLAEFTDSSSGIFVSNRVANLNVVPKK